MKRLAVFAGIVLTLLVALAAATPLLIPAEFVKRQLNAQIAAWTGRAVTLSGPASISLFPYLAVRVNDVSLANAGGMGAKPLVAMDALVGRIKLLPLIAGRVEIAEFRLVHPHVNLEVDAAGQPNWLLTDGVIGAQAAATDPNRGVKTATPAAGPEIRLGEFVMENGTVDYSDLRSGRTETASGINLEMRWPASTRPAMARGTLLWRGQPMDVSGTISAPLDVLAGGASPARFALTAKALKVTFNGNLLRLGTFQLEGDAQVTAPSVRQALAWMGTPIGDGAILGPGSVAGRVNWIGPTISFANASVTLDGNSGSGVVSVDLSGTRPKFEGTLDFEKLDVSPYVAAVSAEIKAAGSWPVAPIRLPLVAAADLDLRISAGQVLAGPSHVERVAGAVTVKDGRIALNIGEAQFYTGRLEAQLTGEMRDDDFVATAQAKLDKVPAKLALAATGVTALEGLGSATLSANVHGRSWGELADTFAAKADVALNDGKLAGIGIADLAKRLSAGRDDLVEPPSGTTAFKTISGSFSLAEGTVSTGNLHAEGAGYAVEFGGSASLYSALVEGLGMLTVAPSSGPAKVARIPFAIGGTLGAPVFLAHSERLFRRSSLDRPALMPAGTDRDVFDPPG